MMNFSRMSTLFVGLAAAMSLLLSSCAPKEDYIVITGFAQGGTYTVKLNMLGEEGRVKPSPEEIRDSIDCILGRIDRSLSGYNKGSLLSRLNAGEAVVPDSLFMDMYAISYDIYRQTEGVVDVASAPLFDVWGFGFSKGEFPSQAAVDSAKAASGMHRLAARISDVVPEGSPLSLSSLVLEGQALPKLNFNAVAQGYSCDLIAEYLYSIGVKDMLVDIGEFFCDGRNPSGRPWSIGIDRPIDGNNQKGAHLQSIFRAPDGPHGIVTSGNYRKFYVRDGKKYAHSIDPRSGQPVSHSLLSATVLARDAVTADAYATWCMVVGLEQAKAFLEQTEGFEGCLIYGDEGLMRTWCSSGFVLEEL